MNKYQLPNVSTDPLYSDLGGNEVLKSKQLILSVVPLQLPVILNHAMNRWDMKVRKEEIRLHRIW